MTTRTIYYDAVAGHFKMSEDQDRDWHRTHDDYITGVVLRDESPAPSGDDALQVSQQIRARMQYDKRDRREALINRGLAFALALVVIGLVLIVLGVLR